MAVAATCVLDARRSECLGRSSGRWTSRQGITVRLLVVAGGDFQAFFWLSILPILLPIHIRAAYARVAVERSIVQDRFNGLCGDCGGPEPEALYSRGALDAAQMPVGRAIPLRRPPISWSARRGPLSVR